MAEPTPLSASPAAIATAFAGEYRRPPTSAGYSAALLTTALLALLVPMLYLGMIAGTAYGTFELVTMLAEPAPQGRASAGRLALAALAGVLGLTLVIFLVKPFIIRGVDDDAAVELDAKSEPVLFAYVGALAAVVGAPIPTRLEVDCSPNAAASMGRGVVGSMFGRRLTLRLGLPLAAALDARALAGVIAHELGHFAQGAGMRASLIVRAVNFWLARRIFVRDRFDYRLALACGGAFGPWWQVVAWPVSLVLGVARWALWALLALSTITSAFMLRRMEFNADLVAVRVSGVEAFERTERALARLAGAERYHMASLRRAWAEKRLPDNLPVLIASTAQRLPEDVARQVEQEMAKAGKSIFSTHPPAEARIAAARSEGSPGVCALEGPGVSLFRAFEDGCKRATYARYRVLLGERVFDATIVDSKPAQRQRQADEKSGTALERLFPAGLHPDRPLALEMRTLEAPHNAREGVQRLRDVGTRLGENTENWKRALKDLDDASARRRGALAARALLDSGITRFSASKFRVPGTSREQVRAALHAADGTLESVASRLDQYEALPLALMRDGLQLLRVSKVAERVKGADRLAAAAERLLPAMGCVRDAAASRKRLEDELGALESMLAAFTIRRGMDEHYASAVFSKTRDVCDNVNRLRQNLQHERYPFEHSRPNATIADFVHETLPNPNEPVQAAECAALTLGRLHSLRVRMLGHLAAIAVEVEKAVAPAPGPAAGTPHAATPLPAPKEAAQPAAVARSAKPR